MFCRKCNLQFRNASGKCPSCGRSADLTAAEAGLRSGPRPAPASVPAPTPVGTASKGAAPAASPAFFSSGASGLVPPPDLSAGAPEPRPAARGPAVTPPRSEAPRPPPPVPAVPDENTRSEKAPGNLWAPGSRIAGKYEIISTLGSGGFGTVFKVRHIFRKKYYALKTPHSQYLKDDVFRRRFEREIEAMERFVHPDAVMIRDCGVTEQGIPYYTMDFIDGENLKTVLSRERRLAPERAVKIIRRVLRVLEAAHEHRIIHRDIKPDNILLTQSGGREHVKVLDFGVAKLLDLVGWTSITHGARVGTPRYMSPEQITGDPLDARSDLFSLGTVFYEVVTGEHPFARESDPIRVTAAILSRTPAPPRDLVSELPRQLSDRILWMLEKKPRKRPASARAALEALPDLEDDRSHSRAEPGAMEVHPGAPRAAESSLVLRQDTPEGERRSFLLFKEKVTFGRSGDIRAGGNDLVLRCLPCRSQELDPENWRKNLTISSQAGTIRPDGSVLVIEPGAESKGGVAVNGVKSLRPVPIQTDRFHLSLGDRALEIDGYRRLKRSDRPALDLSRVLRGRPAGIPFPTTIGYGQPGSAIDFIRLCRANNYPLHEYFLVYRQLVLGSAADAGLHVPGEDLEGEHAVLVFEGGEVFLAPMEGDVRVRPAGAPGGAEASKHELVLPVGSLYPVVPGIEISLRSAVIRVDAGSAEWYKKV